MEITKLMEARNRHTTDMSYHDARALFGKGSVKRRTRLGLDRLDLGILSFIIDGPKIPVIDKTIEVEHGLADGYGWARGLRSKLGPVHVKPKVPELDGEFRNDLYSITGIAIGQFLGRSDIGLGVQYSGSLTIPSATDVFHLSQDGAPSAKDVFHLSQDGVTTAEVPTEYVAFQDPLLADRLETNPNCIEDNVATTEPRLFGNEVTIMASTGRFGETVSRLSEVLAQIDEGGIDERDILSGIAKSLLLNKTQLDILVLIDKFSATPQESGMAMLKYAETLNN